MCENPSKASSTEISLNLKFSTKATKIAFSVCSLKEDSEEKRRNDGGKLSSTTVGSEEEPLSPRSALEIATERKYAVESLIVKVLKSKRKFELTNTVLEVIKLSAKKHFVPDEVLVKNSIDSLLARDYLKYSEDKVFLLYVL